MSSIKLESNASGTGIFTIASPNSNTNRTLTLPDATGTINTSGSSNEVPAGSASAPSIYPAGDTNTGIFFPAADTIAFAEGGAEVARFDSSGNLGIGTTSPDSRLSIDHSSTSTSVLAAYANIPLLLQNTSSTDNNWSVIAVQDASGDFSSYIGTQNTSQSSNTAIMAFATNGGSGATERVRINSIGEFKASTTGTYPDATGGGHMFRTAANGVTLTINNNIGSGLADTVTQITLGYAANTSNSYFIYCNDSSAARMYVRTDGGIGNYSGNNVNLSDQREKKDFAPAKNYLDVICNIPVQTFNYIDQSEDNPGLTLGVVAQDVQAVAPELVMESDWSTEKDGSKMRLSIYQTDLQYALMKSIQELKAINDAQATRIETLEAQNAAFEARLAALENT